MIESVIRGAIHGNNFKIPRTVNNIPDGETVDKAWFTIKARASQLDVDAAMQKEITPASGVTNSSPVGSVDLEFDISGSDWDNVLPDKLYRYDIQILTDSGVYTVERGTFLAKSRMTQANS